MSQQDVAAAPRPSSRWSNSANRRLNISPQPPPARPTISETSNSLIPLPPLPPHPPIPCYIPLSQHLRRQRHAHLSLVASLDDDPDPTTLIPSRPLLSPIPISDLRHQQCRSLPPWDATRHPLPTPEPPVISPRQPNTTFHLFQRLPPEMRAHVWKQYCPQLAQSSRVYSITLYNSPDLEGRRRFRFRDELELSSMTHAMRNVMKIHRESRVFASGIVPDSFTITYLKHSKDSSKNKQGIVRFNRQTDIIHMTNASAIITELHPRHLPADYLENVQNVALDMLITITERQQARYIDILAHFVNIKTVYACQTSVHTSPRALRWVTSPKVYSQLVETSFRAAPIIFSWPKDDLETPEELFDDIAKLKSHAQKKGWTLLPMVQFLSKFGWDQYDLLHKTKDMTDSEFDDNYITLPTTT